MSTRMRDLMYGALDQLRYEPTEKRVRATLGDEPCSTARARCSCGSRGGSSRPTPSRRPTSSPRAPAPASDADAPRGSCTRASRSSSTPPPASRSTIGDARAPGSGSRDSTATSRSTSPPSTRGTRRTSGSSATRAIRSRRVDVRQTSRPIRIEVDGEVVAETTRARLLYETQDPDPLLPPAEDVRVAARRRATCAPTARTRARRPTCRSRPAAAAREPRLVLRAPAPGRAPDHRAGRVLGRARRRLRRRRAPSTPRRTRSEAMQDEFGVRPVWSTSVRLGAFANTIARSSWRAGGGAEPERPRRTFWLHTPPRERRRCSPMTIIGRRAWLGCHVQADP